MKAGIVTSCHCKNFGADLQAYALLKWLSKHNVAAEVIDFDRAEPPEQVLRQLKLRAIMRRLRRSFFRGAIEIMVLSIKMMHRRFCGADSEVLNSVQKGDLLFEDFWNKEICHSKKILLNQFGTQSYDVYVAGSDQIWNWTKTGNLDPFFLKGFPASATKVAYAASFSDDTLPQIYQSVYKDGLTNFDFLSVRESQACTLLQPFVAKKIYWVMDPTLLFTSDDWQKVCHDVMEVDTPYIFSYSLNESTRYLKIVDHCARTLGMKVINITRAPYRSQYASILNVYDAGPLEFVGLLSRSDFVITNSFHGTIFAINFHKNFLSLLNPASTTNSRVLSVAEKLKLETRVRFDDEKFDPVEEINRKIDFASVDKILSEWRTDSEAYLKNALHLKR